MNKLLIISLIAIVSIVSFIAVYIFVLPMLISKPTMEKPTLSSNATVSTDTISYVMNELSAYKLTKSLTGEDPEIEILVHDENFNITQTFSVTVQNNVPSAKLGNATNPDIRVTATREVFNSLLSATDFNKEVVSLYNQGKIKLEFLKGQLTLVAKGYKAIYDQLQQK